MANTVFQLRRNTVSGTRPTTSTVSPGELAINTTDGILFSANATTVFEVGSNNTTVAIGNSTFRSTINSSSFSIANTVAVTANGSTGTSGQVLSSNGSSVYWANSANVSSIVSQQFTANGTANSFTVSGGYIPSAIEVYVTGVKKIPVTEIDITSGTTVNFVTPPLNGQIVDVFGYQSTGSISGYLPLAGGTLSGVTTFSANIVLGSSGLSANGSFGTAGHVLHSNGTASYWAADDQGVTSVATGSGLTGGTITSTGTISVLANTGIVANATGLYVDASYINTISSNSATYANASISNTFTVGTASYFVANGNVGIGNTAPNAKLQVTGTANVSGNVVIGGSLSSANLTTTTNTATFGTNVYLAAGGNSAIGTSNTTSARLRIDTTGGGGYGRDAPNIWITNGNDPGIRMMNTSNATLNHSATMYVPGGAGGWVVTCDTNAAFDLSTDTSGNFTARGNVTAYSDAKLKKDVENIQNALATVMQLRGVKFRRIDNDDDVNIGFIAQEIQEHVPEVVHNTLEGYLGVSYGNIVALLTEAIKEQQHQIEQLRSEIKEMRT